MEAVNFPREIWGKYDFLRRLGSGWYGSAMLVFDKKTHKKYALKIYECSKVENILTVNHRHLVQTENCVSTRSKIYVVQEYMEGGDLSKKICRSCIAEPIAKFYLHQVFLAVEFLHDNGITHWNLKPQNIMMSSWEDRCLVKLADFGITRMKWGTNLLSPGKTRSYRAPELMLASESWHQCTSKVDVWSLGVILYQCLVGELPFITDQDAVEGRYWFPRDTLLTLSDSSVDLIRNMLVVSPDERLNMKQILAHWWLHVQQCE